MTAQVTMPQLGESVVEGTVGKWLVREGDWVEKDQPVVEILTDKADSEIPATTAGQIKKIHFQEGATVKVGQALLDIDPQASKDAAAKTASNGDSGKSNTSASASAPASAKVSTPAPAATSAEPPSSPAVRKLAREHGLALNAISGSGDGGRITKDDVIKAASTPAAATLAAPSVTATSNASLGASATKASAFQVPAYNPKPGDEIVPFSRRRRIIADHMVYSKLTSPHVMAVAECDLHKTSKVREEYKNVLKKEGINLTFLAFVASAVTRALREHRELNARVLEDAYVLLREINLGIAVDTPEGLVVPVIRNADELTVRGIARSIEELALRARDGKLKPDDLAGKTFTVTNPGKKGNLFGGAIISQPNVGILRVGEIQKRVVVVEHEGEDLMAIHPVMLMALSYDHRIVDGAPANSFLYRVVEILESGDFEI